MRLSDHLLDTFASSWQVLEQTVEDCPPEALRWRADGATIESIARIYAHTVLASDVMVHEILLGTGTVLERQGWRDAIGVRVPVTPLQDDQLAAMGDVDVALLRPYAAAVREAIGSYVGGLQDAELSRIAETPMGPMSVASLVGNFVVWHIAVHTGEIAALKGAQGLKGLPF